MPKKGYKSFNSFFIYNKCLWYNLDCVWKKIISPLLSKTKLSKLLMTWFKLESDVSYLHITTILHYVDLNGGNKTILESSVRLKTYFPSTIVPEEGSTAKTATLNLLLVIICPNLSMKVDCPAPGGPDNPIRNELKYIIYVINAWGITSINLLIHVLLIFSWAGKLLCQLCDWSRTRHEWSFVNCLAMF